MYNSALEDIKDKKARRESGDVIAIPYGLPRLSTVLPGIEQSRYSLITGATKAAKTQVTNFLYVYQPIEWFIQNRNRTDITIKIKYFSLEISAREQIYTAMSYKLFKDYGIIRSPQDLQSVFEGYILEDDILRILESKEFRDWFEIFESIVEFHDEVRNPTGIMNIIQTYADQNGTYDRKIIDWQQPDGSYTKREVNGDYKANKPKEYVIIITDNYNLLAPEKGERIFDTIGRFSSQHMLKCRDKWRYCPVGIMQQSADSTSEQFTMGGKSIVDKLRPTKEGLSDCKKVGNDVNLLLGIFSPSYYQLEEYKGYDLRRIGQNFRELSIILNRNGIASANLPLYFNGASNFFKELPKADDMTEKIYNSIKS